MLSYSFSFLYSNHIDLKIVTFYIKSFVYHESYLNCIFKFKKLRNAIYAFTLICIKKNYTRYMSEISNINLNYKYTYYWIVLMS